MPLTTLDYVALPLLLLGVCAWRYAHYRQQVAEWDTWSAHSRRVIEMLALKRTQKGSRDA